MWYFGLVSFRPFNVPVGVSWSTSAMTVTSVCYQNLSLGSGWLRLPIHGWSRGTVNRKKKMFLGCFLPVSNLHIQHWAFVPKAASTCQLPLFNGHFTPQEHSHFIERKVCKGGYTSSYHCVRPTTGGIFKSFPRTVSSNTFYTLYINKEIHSEDTWSVNKYTCEQSWSMLTSPLASTRCL